MTSVTYAWIRTQHEQSVVPRVLQYIRHIIRKTAFKEMSLIENTSFYLYDILVLHVNTVSIF